MNPELAVIGGVGYSLGGLADEVETAYGRVPVVYTRMRGKRMIFISRHGDGSGGHLPPHRVNYRAIISAAKKSGATAVISTNTVGGMAGQPLGSIFLPDDFVEFTKCRPSTFFEDKTVHVEMSRPYCPVLRAALAGAARSLSLPISEGVYVCTEGPHLESPAQIRMMRLYGDVVGMTGYPEVALAREAEMCYASICIVTNPAAGMSEKQLSASEIAGLMDGCRQSISDIIYRAAQDISADRPCRCRQALADAGL